MNVFINDISVYYVEAVTPLLRIYKNKIHSRIHTFVTLCKTTRSIKFKQKQTY